ncbi:MAG: 16S rRNA (cytosine(1402)-N(4))-methyltransferase RsmH [Verrucomicrobiota bacterium]
MSATNSVHERRTWPERLFSDDDPTAVSLNIRARRSGFDVHQPVLLHEVISLMKIKPDGRYIDATLGGGGHAEAILETLQEEGRLLGFDCDPDAIERTGKRLKRFGGRCHIVHSNFRDLAMKAEERQFNPVDGVLMDIGVSSFQLDQARRGFSFSHDGPLDMRMDHTRAPTAADLVNREDEKTLADLIYRFGEERNSRRIARRIVERRAEKPITTTGELAEVVASASRSRGGRIHPATRTFQALRIAVNREMENLEIGLEAAMNLLKVGGRLGVITFHSLEDRLVKTRFRDHVGREKALEAGGAIWEGRCPRGRLVNRKPVVPEATEVNANPRSRSAKLRVWERI